MLSFLKNHPFGVEAFFQQSVVLSFAVPKEDLQALLPPCLELDTLHDKWGFIAVAMVQTTGLRPKGFPAFMGHDFFLAGYRIFVRYTNAKGKRLRGLYILRSETDQLKMQWLGNLFTHYNYTTTDISMASEGAVSTIQSRASDFRVRYTVSQDGAPLPAGSPFADWKEARRFAGPLPFTFSYNKAKQEVLIIEGVREHWIPHPLTVLEQHFSFIESFRLKHVLLANAFIIQNIPYHWKKGIIETWQPPDIHSRE